MPPAHVLIAAWPRLYATALAEGLRGLDDLDVVVADLDAVDWEPAEGFDAAIASVPVPRTWADVIVELPTSLEEPLRVTIGDVTIESTLDEPTVEAVFELLRCLLAERPAGSG